MRFSKIAIGLVSGISCWTSLACKCLIDGVYNNITATENCCNQIFGNFRFGVDCKADSISQDVLDFAFFHNCCENNDAKSDCI
ncbi:hypothetical protein GGR57DRAFT_486748, partial [Xylariaceae sp. FL1272]